ncbi:hypothetical protein [Porphyromonas sp.]
MQIKHIAKTVIWSLVATFVFAACQHEDLSTPQQSTLDQTPKKSSGRTIQLSISNDVNLPAGLLKSIGRNVRFVLRDGEKNHLRPRIEFSLSSYQTKLYLRKKGSTDPKDIFSVTIEDGDWQVRDIQGNKIRLGAGTNGNQLLEKEVPGGDPIMPSDYYPKNLPQAQKDDAGDVIRDGNGKIVWEEWEAAAIVCEGDRPSVGKSANGKYWIFTSTVPAVPDPVGMAVNSALYYTGNTDNRDAIDDSQGFANTFRQDGVWMIYPRGITYRYNTFAEYVSNEENFNQVPTKYLELLKLFVSMYDTYKAGYTADKTKYNGIPEDHEKLANKADEYKRLAQTYDPAKEKRTNYENILGSYKALFEHIKLMFAGSRNATGDFIAPPELGEYLDKHASNLTRDEPTPMDSFTGTMDIPFCADWTPVTLSGDDPNNPILQIRLQAKSPGSILHYELMSDADAENTPVATPSMVRAYSPSGVRRHSFRSKSGSGGILPTDILDNLETNAGRCYGALWYGQDQKAVHWERGPWLVAYKDEYTKPDEDNIESVADVVAEGDYDYYSFHAPNRDRFPVFRRTFGIHRNNMDPKVTHHILYFLLPRYDSEKNDPDYTPKTEFWLSGKKWNDDFLNAKYGGGSEDADRAGGFIPYDEDAPFYTVQKAGQTVGDKYVSTTQPQPNRIHYVRLKWKKK